MSGKLLRSAVSSLHPLARTKYDTPRVFRLASYSTVFQDDVFTITYQTAQQPFAAKHQTVTLPVNNTSYPRLHGR